MRWLNKSQSKQRAKVPLLSFVFLVALLLSSAYMLVPAFRLHQHKPAHAEGATTSTGMWLNKGDTCVWQPGHSCTLTVQADPVSSSNPVALVKVLALWNETWYTLCKMPTPDSGTIDHYSCTITDWHTTDNFSYPPNGPIRFRYDIVDSQGATFFSTNDEFIITFGGNGITPTPTVPANYAPCTGQWYDGGYTGEVYTKGNPQVITARVWPAAAGNPTVVQVEFLSQWPDGTRHDLAFVTTPRLGTTDQYTIYTDMKGIDGKYPPDGPIQVAFLCTDATGKSSTFLDGGFHQGVFQSSAPSNPQPPQYNGSVNLCTGTGYTNCTNYKVGSYPTLGSLTNAISSIQTGANCHVSMYLQPNFQGNVGYVDSSNPDLSQFSKSSGLPNGFSKDIQSIKIENCTGDPPPIDPQPQPTGTSTPGSGQPTPTGTITSGGPTQPGPNKLFVFVEGLSTNSDMHDFASIQAAIAQSNNNAHFLYFSYTGSDSNGNPNPYICVNTLASHISWYVGLLKSQINAYMSLHANTQVYIIGHSMGGAIAFGLLADMMVHSYIDTNGGSIQAVATLDSPLGGVPEGPVPGFLPSWYYTLTLQHYQGEISCAGTAVQGFVAQDLYDLTQVFNPGNTPYGANDSLESQITKMGLSNQEVAKSAATNGIHVLTVENLLDFVYQPGDCGVGLSPHTHFIDTQTITDGGANSGVYARSFANGNATCPDTNHIPENHNVVFTTQSVINDLVQFVAGGTPNQLM